MEITATFKGENSLGYIKGNTYRLIVKGLIIRKLDKSSYCVYTSLESFLLNWDNIKIIKSK